MPPRSTRRRTVKVRVSRPEQPEARDEGPRLLPLPDPDRNTEHTGKLQHYINLADIALKAPRFDKGRR